MVDRKRDQDQEEAGEQDHAEQLAFAELAEFSADQREMAEADLLEEAAVIGPMADQLMAEAELERRIDATLLREASEADLLAGSQVVPENGEDQAPPPAAPGP